MSQGVRNVTTVPLTAELNGRLLDASTIDEADWSAVHRVRPLRDLVCPGCATPMTAKGTDRVANHFAHRPGGGRDCVCAGEGPEHRRLKSLVRDICEGVGWDAKLEEHGVTNGQNWWADVLAADPVSGRRLVFEIQFAYQSDAAYSWRSAARTGAGCGVIWLVPESARTGFGQVKLLHAVNAGGDTIVGPFASWTSRGWALQHRVIPLDQAVCSVLSGGFVWAPEAPHAWVTPVELAAANDPAEQAAVVLALAEDARKVHEPPKTKPPGMRKRAWREALPPFEKKVIFGLASWGLPVFSVPGRGRKVFAIEVKYGPAVLMSIGRAEPDAALVVLAADDPTPQKVAAETQIHRLDQDPGVSGALEGLVRLITGLERRRRVADRFALVSTDVQDPGHLHRSLF
jgi:hypothetical protein